MKLVSANCPNCGALIEVSPETETTRCKFCGSAILVEDAIQKFKIEVSGQVSMSGISTVENDIERGNQCLAARDWQTAFKIFSMAINKKANSYSAWIGCLDAVTQNDNAIDFSWVQFSGATGLETIILNCLRYSSQEQLPSSLSKIKMINQIIRSQIESDAEKKRSHSEKVRRGWAIFFFIVFFLYFICIIASIQHQPALILVIIPLFLVFFLPALLLSKHVKPDKFYNQTLVSYTTVIDNILSGIKT